MIRQHHSIRSAASTGAAPGAAPGSQRSVEVVLLNREKFLVYIEGKQARVQDVFLRACEHLGLRETEYFGLALLIDGEYQFQNLEHKLHKLAPKQWKIQKQAGEQENEPVLTLFFRVQYYVDHISLLKERVTRNLYYLQLRDNLLNHSQSMSEEKCFLIAASALQADFGDYTKHRQTPNYFDPREYFPAWVVDKYGDNYILQHMPKFQAELNVVMDHNKRRSLTKTEAQMQFIREVSLPPIAHNLHFYQLKKRKTDELGSIWMAICPKGIQMCEVLDHNNLKSSLSTFLWSEIQKLHHDKKKFELVTKDRRRFLYYTGSDNRSKYLFSLSESTHKFNLKMQPRLAEIRHMEETDKRTSERYVYCENTEFSWERSSVHSRSSLHSGRHSPRVEFTGRPHRMSLISSNSSNTTSGIVSQHASLDESEEDVGREILITSPPMPQPVPWQSVIYSSSQNSQNGRSPTPVLSIRPHLRNQSISRSSSGHSQKSGKFPLLLYCGIKAPMASTPIVKGSSRAKPPILTTPSQVVNMLPPTTVTPIPADSHLQRTVFPPTTVTPIPADSHLQRTVFPQPMLVSSRTVSSSVPVTRINSTTQNSSSFTPNGGENHTASQVESQHDEDQQLYVHSLQHPGQFGLTASQQEEADSTQYKMLAQANNSSGRAATMDQFMHAQQQLRQEDDKRQVLNKQDKQHNQQQQQQQLQEKQQVQLQKQQLQLQEQQQLQLHEQQQQLSQQQLFPRQQQEVHQQQLQQQEVHQQQLQQQEVHQQQLQQQEVHQQQLQQQEVHQQQLQQHLRQQQIAQQLAEEEAALYAGMSASSQYQSSSILQTNNQNLYVNAQANPPTMLIHQPKYNTHQHSSHEISLTQSAGHQNQQPNDKTSVPTTTETFPPYGTYSKQVIQQTCADPDLPPLTVTETISKATPAQYQPQQVVQQTAMVLPVSVATPQVANSMVKPNPVSNEQITQEAQTVQLSEQPVETVVNDSLPNQMSTTQQQLLLQQVALQQIQKQTQAQAQAQAQAQHNAEMLSLEVQAQQRLDDLAILKQKQQEELERNEEKQRELLQYLEAHQLQKQEVSEQKQSDDLGTLKQQQQEDLELKKHKQQDLVQYLEEKKKQQWQEQQQMLQAMQQLQHQQLQQHQQPHLQQPQQQQHQQLQQPQQQLQNHQPQQHQQPQQLQQPHNHEQLLQDQLDSEEIQLHQLLENCSLDQLAEIQQLQYQLQYQQQMEEENLLKELRTQQHEHQLDEQLLQYKAHLEQQTIQELQPQSVQCHLEQQTIQELQPQSVQCHLEQQKEEQFIELKQYKEQQQSQQSHDQNLQLHEHQEQQQLCELQEQQQLCELQGQQQLCELQEQQQLCELQEQQQLCQLQEQQQLCQLQEQQQLCQLQEQQQLCQLQEQQQLCQLQEQQQLCELQEQQQLCELQERLKHRELEQCMQKLQLQELSEVGLQFQSQAHDPLTFTDNKHQHRATETVYTTEQGYSGNQPYCVDQHENYPTDITREWELLLHQAQEAVHGQGISPAPNNGYQLPQAATDQQSVISQQSVEMTDVMRHQKPLLSSEQDIQWTSAGQYLESCLEPYGLTDVSQQHLQDHESRQHYLQEHESRQQYIQEHESCQQYLQDHESRQQYIQEHESHQQYLQEHESHQPYLQEHESHQPYLQEHESHQQYLQEHESHQPYLQEHESHQQYLQEHESHQQYLQDHESHQPYLQEHESHQQYLQEHESHQQYLQDHESHDLATEQLQTEQFLYNDNVSNINPDSLPELIRPEDISAHDLLAPPHGFQSQHENQITEGTNVPLHFEMVSKNIAVDLTEPLVPLVPTPKPGAIEASENNIEMCSLTNTSQSSVPAQSVVQNGLSGTTKLNVEDILSSEEALFDIQMPQPTPQKFEVHKDQLVNTEENNDQLDVTDSPRKVKSQSKMPKSLSDDDFLASVTINTHSPWCPLHSVNPSHIEEVQAKKAGMPLLSGLLNANDLRQCRCHFDSIEPNKRKSYAHPAPEPMWNEPGTVVRPVSWHYGNFTPEQTISAFKELNIGEARSNGIFGSEMGEVRVNGLDMTALTGTKEELSGSPRLVPAKISSGGRSPNNGDALPQKTNLSVA